MIFILFKIKCLFEGLFKNKIKNIIVLLQVTFSLILFYFIISKYINLYNLEQKISELDNHNDIQILFDISDESRLFTQTFQQEDIINRLNEFYKYLSLNKDFKSYTLSDSIIEIMHNKLPSKSNVLYVNKGFMEQFNIEIVNGRKFNEEDFKDKKITPILLGEDLKKSYILGEEINDINGNVYKVIGFINKNSFYLDLKKSDEINYFKNSIVAPIQDKNLNSVPDYDMIINNTYILSKDKSVLSKIQDKSSELGLYTYKFKSLKNQFESIKKSNEDYIKSISLMLILILGFSIVSCISNILQYIDDNWKYFSIHRLCGASMKSILLRIMLPIISIIIIADIVVISLYGIELSSIITILFSMLLIIFITIFPYSKLKKLKLIELLRGYN